MDKAVEILMLLVKYGPDAIAFAERTYGLFKNGEITAEELLAQWEAAKDSAARGEAKWDAAPGPTV